MPSGITSEIYSGEKPVTFKDFALRCARSFGALIEMRDEPMDAKIPDEFAPSDHHEQALKRCKAELAMVTSMTESEADFEASLVFDRAMNDYRNRLSEVSALKKRYENMLAQVDAWQPPTSDHIELKRFMQNQLRESIKFDCYEPGVPERIPGRQYREDRLASICRSISYHAEQYEKEITRCKERTQWVKALLGSLK